MEKPSYSLQQNGLLFSQLAGQLCNLLYERNQDKTRINALIDQLNALNYKSGFFVAHHDATSVITAICLNVNTSDSFLAAKASHVLTSIVSRQNLLLTTQSSRRIVQWDLACLRSCSNIVLLDILHNLQTVLYHSPSSGFEFIEDFIGEQGMILNFIQNIDQYSELLDKRLDAVLLAFKCLVSLTIQTEEAKNPQLNSDKLENICRIIIKFLYRGCTKSEDEFSYCKVVVHALRILSQIYLDRHEDIEIPLPDVMGLCKCFLLYGLVADSKPQKIAPSQHTIAQPIVKNARGGKKQKVRKQRNSAVEGLKKEIPISDRNLTNNLNNYENEGYRPVCNTLSDTAVKTGGFTITSDSDLSDVEGGRDAKRVALKTRVRQSAHNFLLVLIKVTEMKDMFGYWWTLLPDSPNPDAWSAEESTKRTLAYCAVNDPMSVGRSGSLSVMLALLAGSRIYLSQAEMCKREITSFTPFSIRLGHTISCLHRVLCSILERERVAAVVLVALKCCAALIQATPYHRMQVGLISELVRVSRSYLVHRDTTMQVAALVVTGCVLSVDPAVEEILQSVQKDMPMSLEIPKPNPPPQTDECEDFEEGYSDDEDIFTTQHNTQEKKEMECFRSWVLDVCFKNLGWVFRNGVLTRCNKSAIPLILESLQVISAIAFHHFASLLLPHVRLLSDVFVSLLDSQADVVLQTCKTLSSVADAILKLEQSQPGLPPLSDCLYFWESLLSKPLPSVLQASDNHAAKAVACDCMANIGERVFRELPRRTRVACVTLVSGSCCDEEAGVRAAGVRALAVCALCRTLREDPCFISDCGENVLRLVRDAALTVRVKAAWSLGNLSDVLALNMKDPEIEDVDDGLLLRLLEASVQCATQNEKIKMSAMRAIGNLLRLVTTDRLHSRPQLKQLAEDGLQRLVDCASKGNNMKLRWNACYAIGNAIGNPALYVCLTGWQKSVLSCLCSLVQECKNFKVRITAATALRSPASRDQYSAHLAAAWGAVVAAMEAANNVDDYTEYKHKDNLVEQLCVTLAHLCCQLSPTDLPDILDPLSFHLDCARTLVANLSHKLPPEHESYLKILEAAKYVTVSLSAETDSQRQTLAMLQELFIWDASNVY